MNHCTYVGTSQMCTAISILSPCQGEVSSTWITQVCASMLAACAHSYMLLHQFSSPPGFPTCTGTEAHPKPCIVLLLPAKQLFSHRKAPSVHLRGCPSALSHSFTPCLCALGVCRCAPHVFTPLHTYLSTPACKYLHVPDLTYLLLFSSVPLYVLMTLKALLSPANLLGLHSLYVLQCFFPSGVL